MTLDPSKRYVFNYRHTAGSQPTKTPYTFGSYEELNQETRIENNNGIGEIFAIPYLAKVKVIGFSKFAPGASFCSYKEPNLNKEYFFHPWDFQLELDEGQEIAQRSSPMLIKFKHSNGCECGIWATGSELHSDWCPKYSKYR